MQNVHSVDNKVNESVIILKVKPNQQPNDNFTIEGDIGFFIFMNLGTGILLI